MSQATRKAKATVQDTTPVLDPAAIEQYNAFIASLQLKRIELAELGARSERSDLAEVTLQVGTKFAVTCPQRDEQGFTAEARLQLSFHSEEQGDLGQITCAYRVEYTSDIPVTDAIFEQFAQRNVPLNIWPFLRETVMNITQRFGWSGFVLPPFRVPAASSTAPAEAEKAEKGTSPRKTTRKAASKPASRKVKAVPDEQQEG